MTEQQLDNSVKRAESDHLIHHGKGDLSRLVEIMRRLRAPDGCPWDQKQTSATIAPYAIEEAYELNDAITRKDIEDIKSELGDVLLQVIFHAQIADENGDFTLSDVISAISDKMIARHPHVFGNAEFQDEEALSAYWESHKARERAHKHQHTAQSILDDIPQNFPALMRACKIQRRVGQAGFDWPEISGVFDKITEETKELKEVIDKNGPAEDLDEEYGDLLFAVANLGRHLKIRPEGALNRANMKFETRFRALEAILKARGHSLEDASLEEMENIWQQVKQAAQSPTDAS